MQCPDCDATLPLAAGNCANCGALIDNQLLQVVVAPPGSQPLTAKQAWQFFLVGLVPWSIMLIFCWWFFSSDGWLYWLVIGIFGCYLVAKIGRLIFDLWRSKREK
ncbi:hypothetical protein [Herpetosiphon gulosus]|uniref:Zinc ribbon domain-containing protein n=1 Tax=Herpetosiphon gulosus TaxID=1973496 RepID=A0ABP9WVB8_9CHLR